MKKKSVIALAICAAVVLAGSQSSILAQGELTAEKKGATEITRQVNEDVYQLLDFSDTQEVEFAEKGFITAPDSL